HLLLPRVLAGLLVVPALTMFANATGIVVGYMVAKGSLGLTYGDFEYGARYFFRPLDLWYSLIKRYCFAAAVTLIPCYIGFNTQQGAEGVGRATTTAVVSASVAIRLLDDLKTINGLLRPDTGDVIVDGLHVPKLKRKELSELRAKIGYVFQYGALFDSMTVAENIRLGITDETCYNDEKFCDNRVQECLRLVNLQLDVAGKYPAELSGGMKKRVGIA